MNAVDSSVRSAPPPVPQAAPPSPAPSNFLDGIGDFFDNVVHTVRDIAKSIVEEVQGSTANMPENERLARKLVEAGGTGDQADVDLVVAELSKMPVTAPRQMDAAGTKVVACQDSVTDYAADLKGVQQRGRAATGEGHGSANLVIHESAHAVDAMVSGSLNSASPAFNAARKADIGALPSYETQPGAAGQSESYAESAARYYGGSHGSINTPALDAYWRDNPLGGR
ncbi:hypothetical protein M0208_02955 [Sphingomonas sp. SUN019]|uniref:hypothetical protein n=1 Tax=Sphingomonas sp. SUN019 TaxID=2937788 RepID=UPI0021648004|nr:hypothetical protein [Sphingomonas sp. SUN019]UVO49520.1 hypothetical protein M0208_02955 [Sphingomonas sp. SUN019]